MPPIKQICSKKIRTKRIAKSNIIETFIFFKERSFLPLAKSGHFISDVRCNDNLNNKSSKHFILFRPSLFGFAQQKAYLLVSNHPRQKSNVHLNPLKFVVQRKRGRSRKLEQRIYTQNTNKMIANRASSNKILPKLRTVGIFIPN